MHRGFTLIELMICVAIIGILATAAVPLYHGYVNEASSTEARTNLADIASKEEAYFSSWGTYLSTVNASFPQTAEFSYVRRVQQMTANDNWSKIGYPFHADADGGLFAGPVYFQYIVATNDANSTYRACAHRVVGTTNQLVSIASTNRRNFGDAPLNACDAPNDAAAIQGGGGNAGGGNAGGGGNP